MRGFFFKNGIDNIELNALSSGEKQVIYRSTFLLKDNRATLGCPVLLDEPETSMHPKWQEKIYGLYKQLLTETGFQKSQIFIATHSDYIIKSALQDENALILQLNVNEANIFSSKEMNKSVHDTILPASTLGELRWRMFNLPNNDFHSALYGYIQNNLVKDIDGNNISSAAKEVSASVTQTDNFLCNQNDALREWKYKTKIYKD